MTHTPDQWSRFVRELRQLLPTLIEQGASKAICSPASHAALKRAVNGYDAYTFRPGEEPELRQIERLASVPLEVRRGHPEDTLTVIADTWVADLRPKEDRQ